MKEYTKFFKSDKGYDRFIKGIYAKYKSLGKFSGVVKLNNLTSEESYVLTRLFGTTMLENDSVSLSIKKFISIMNDTKFSDFDISVFISEYFGVVLSSKKEDISRLNILEENFFRQFTLGDSIGSKWISDMFFNKSNAYNIIHKRYNKNKSDLSKELENIISCINNLPVSSTFLSIFSASFTGDPHYLDLDSSHSVLFFYALSFLDGSGFPNSREEKILILGKYNILVDNLSNFVITYNLLSDSEGINSFSASKESLILNIQNIVNRKFFDGVNKKVFVFENPSVLSYIISNRKDVSVVISGGYTNISVYLLLDKLVSNGNVLYYNGDFDPEGLLICQKLKDRYKDSIKFICYSKESYDMAISNNLISSQRIKILDRVSDESLKEVKELIIKFKCSGYQENIVDSIVKVI